jgi:hypothetical protein
VLLTLTVHQTITHLPFYLFEKRFPKSPTEFAVRVFALHMRANREGLTFLAKGQTGESPREESERAELHLDVRQTALEAAQKYPRPRACNYRNSLQRLNS